MARVKRGVGAKKRHKKVLEQAKGYYGNKSRSFRAANEQVMHSGQYAFRDRRARKGEFRRLWIQRINAACRLHDMSYSRFIAGLNAAGIEVDRKILADLAVTDAAAFGALVERGQGGALRPTPTERSAFTNPKVQRLRRLLGRRSARSDEGAFVVEGADAGRRGGRRRVGRSRPSSSPPGVDAGRRRRRGRSSWHRASLERVASTETPQPACSPSCACRPPTPTTLGDGDVRRRRRRHRRSRQPRARSCARPRRPASTPSCSPPDRSTVQPEGRARRRPVRCSTCRWSTPTLDVDVRGPGLRTIGTSSHRRQPRTPRPTDPVGSRSSSATRPTGSPDDARGRRVGARSPTPAGPRASTWRWRRPCCASRRPGSASAEDRRSVRSADRAPVAMLGGCARPTQRRRAASVDRGSRPKSLIDDIRAAARGGRSTAGRRPPATLDDVDGARRQLLGKRGRWRS